MTTHPDELGSLIARAAGPLDGGLEVARPQLLVPIDVQAMVARAGDPRARIGVSTADTGRPPPFTDTNDRKPGVHLHWAMPDGLTVADDVDGRPVFPALPDRWVVVRLAPDPGGQPTRSVRTWFLDAATGEITRGDEPRATPRPGGTSPRPPVIATGDTDPAWAAVYDNTVGRFALHDDVADVADDDAQVTYVVVGWYGTLSQDPVVHNDVAGQAAMLRRFGWTMAPTALPAHGLLQRTFCHGTLAGVRVGGPGQGEDPRPAAADVALAVGQTGVESLAALLTTDDPAVSAEDAAKEELALAAAGYEQAGLFGNPEAITLLEELQHASGFERLPGERDETWFQPKDPVVTFRGAGRSLRHGDDGRFDHDGLLSCRSDLDLVTAFSGVVDGPALVTDGALLPGAQGLPDVLRNALLTPVVLKLVRETALLDPFGHDAVVAAAERGGATAPHEVIRREQALAAGELGLDRDLSPLHGGSLRTGTLCSPVGWNNWRQAWVPLYVEWQLATALESDFDAWHLEELDLDRDATAVADTVRSQTHQGRALLTGAPAVRVASQAARLLTDLAVGGPEGVTQAQLDRLAAVARDGRYADLAAAGLDGLVPWLLGLAGNVGAAGPDGVVRFDQSAGPVLVRAGAAWLTRLRIVDAFGRTLDLDDRLPDVRLSQALLPSESLAAAVADLPNPPPPPETRPPAIALAPRLVRPARLRMEVCGADWQPVRPAGPDPELPPVAGWLLPDLVDGAIEVFTPGGDPVGQVRRDPVTGTALWEPPPGGLEDLGVTPKPGLDTGFDMFLHSLVAADVRARARSGGRDEDPTRGPRLSAVDVVLRLLDVTAWTSRPRHDTSAAHVSALVGAPTAVLRMRVTLEVAPDRRESRAAASPAIAQLVTAAGENLAAHGFQARLGAVTRLDDGVRGFLRRDRPEELVVVHPAVLTAAGLVGQPAETEEHASAPELPIAVDSGPLTLQPGVPIDVLVLCDIAGSVTVTTGVLPRAELRQPAEWTAGAPRLLSSFRFGPLLVDPTTVRLPAPLGDDTISHWVHRPAPTSWADDPVVEPPQAGDLPVRQAMVEEGWITLREARKPPDPPPA